MTVLDRPKADLSTFVPPTAKPRLDWVDNVRTATIILVVNMHACVTYSHVGSWYYDAPPEPSLGAKIPFVFWQAHLQSFFMGLLFFLAGYYADRSLARRGPRIFVFERMRRLGLPTLLFMLAIHPLVVIVMHAGESPRATPVADYVHYVLSGRFLSGSGPMWFAFALLLFSLLFAPLASRLPAVAKSPLQVRPTGVVTLGLGLGIASFLLRLWQPMGASVLNFQLCYFAQYVAAFALGVWISRRDGLAALAGSPTARKAGIVALVAGPVALAAVAILSLPAVKHGEQPFNGGWNGIALGYAAWEQLTGVGLALGMMALFARRVNVRTTLSAWLSDRSFAVYLLHTPVLVGLALLVQPVRTTPIVMTIGLTLAGLVVSFLVADAARRLPGLRAIL